MAKIQHSYEIGGYDYLHYWFQNSGMDIVDFNAAKRLSAIYQKDIYDRYLMPTNDNVAQTVDRDLSDLVSNNLTTLSLDNAMKEVFQNIQPPTAGSFSGFKDYSYQKVAIMKNNTRALAKELVNNTGNFISQAKVYLEQLLDGLTNEYGNILTELLEQARNSRAQLSKYELVNKYLQANATSVIDTSGATGTIMKAATTIDRIEGLIESLQNIGSLRGVTSLKSTYSHRSTSTNIKNKGHLIQVIVGKIGGNFSSAGGLFEEIAIKHGACQAILQGGDMISTKVEAMLPKQDKKITSGKGVLGFSYQQSFIPNPELKQMKQMRETASEVYTDPKADVVMRLSQDSATFEFGIQVKTSRAKDLRTRNNIKLHTDASLEQLFEYLVNRKQTNWRYIYHIASSHNLDRQGQYTASGNMSEGAELINGWRSLIDFAIVEYLTNALVGANQTGINNLLLIANRQVFSISDLLGQVAMYPNAVNGSGGRNRGKFSALNKWVGSSQASAAGGQIRSNQVQRSLRAAFNAEKVTIKLNLGALGYSI